MIPQIRGVIYQIKNSRSYRLVSLKPMTSPGMKAGDYGAALVPQS